MPRQVLTETLRAHCERRVLAFTEFAAEAERKRKKLADQYARERVAKWAEREPCESTYNRHAQPKKAYAEAQAAWKAEGERIKAAASDEGDTEVTRRVARYQHTAFCYRRYLAEDAALAAAQAAATAN